MNCPEIHSSFWVPLMNEKTTASFSFCNNQNRKLLNIENKIFKILKFKLNLKIKKLKKKTELVQFLKDVLFNKIQNTPLNTWGI
jgi:hypothetical protein